MNTNEILSFVKNREKLLNKDNVFIITFSIIFTYAGFFFTRFFYRLLHTNEKVPCLDAGVYSNIFVYSFLIYLFIFGLFCGLRLSKIILRFPPGKRSMFINKDGSSMNDFSKIFDFQGYLSDKYLGEECIFLTHSSEGLITKKGFKDFRVNFVAKIFKGGFGVIMCADNLENYFMFKINFDHDKGLYITPHVRKQGIWDIQNVDIDALKNADVEEEDSFTFSIRKEKDKIKLKIFKQKKLLIDILYILPTCFPLLPKKEEEGELPVNIVAKLNFPKFGKFGFRASGGEKAVIYNLKLREL